MGLRQGQGEERVGGATGPGAFAGKLDGVEAMFAGETGCATPKLDVRGAVFKAGQLLLVRETADGDRWTLPGGWADVNESPTESIVKEVREESGFDVCVTKLAAVWDRARHPHEPPYPFYIWKLFFVCAITGGEARGGLETSAVEFFAEDELPRDLSISRVLRPRSGPSPLAEAIAALKADARAASLTDADIDAELAAYNADRRDRQPAD